MNAIYLSDEMLELLHKILANHIEYLTEVQDPVDNEREVAQTFVLLDATSKSGMIRNYCGRSIKTEVE